MASTSIGELFPKARRLMYDLQTQMGYVERGHASADDVMVGLDELARQLRVLENLANQERPTQRENWRRKLRELGAERDFTQQQLERCVSGRQRQSREAREREALMARRESAAAAAATETLAEEGSSLLRSRRQVGEVVASGQAALAALVDQRSRLKGVQRRVLDIASIMGVSNSTLRVADRRQAGDRLLVFGGMILTTALLYWAWSRSR